MQQLRLLVVVAFLMACSSGGGGDTTAPPTNPPGNSPPPTTGSTNTINARVTGDTYGEAVYTWEPASMTVQRGTSVTWANGTGTSHTVTFNPATGAPTNIDAFTGSSSRTFSTPGSFNYQCTIHAGMTGTITVQ